MGTIRTTVELEHHVTEAGRSLFMTSLWTRYEVVFGHLGDMTILGARSMEGLNLRIDPRTKQLVSAGPIVAAPAQSARPCLSVMRWWPPVSI